MYIHESAEGTYGIRTSLYGHGYLGAVITPQADYTIQKLAFFVNIEHMEYRLRAMIVDTPTDNPSDWVILHAVDLYPDHVTPEGEGEWLEFPFPDVPITSGQRYGIFYGRSDVTQPYAEGFLPLTEFTSDRIFHCFYWPERLEIHYTDEYLIQFRVLGPSPAAPSYCELAWNYVKSSFWNLILAVLSLDATASYESLQHLLTDLWDWIWCTVTHIPDYLADFFQTIWDRFIEIWAYIEGVYASAIEYVNDQLWGVWAQIEAIWESLGQAWDWLNNAAQNIYDLVVSYFPWLLDIPDFISSLPDRVWGWITAALEPIINRIIDLEEFRDLFYTSNWLLFVQDCLEYYYNLWSDYRYLIREFFDDPTGFVSKYVLDRILDIIADKLDKAW